MKRTLKRTFIADSPFIRLSKEVNQSPDLRRPLLRKLEKHFNARVVSFFTSFRDWNAQITDSDAEMLESILAVEHDGGKLVLIVSSPGGQALAAERIVNVCRAYSDDAFEVIVPHMAKSAATMICFGASTIHMSKTAELGPVDPQVVFKDDTGTSRPISAEEYVRSYRQLMDAATNGKAKRIEPYLQQLSHIDARYIEFLESAQALSKDISVRLLKSGMMAAKSEAEIEKAIEVFLSQKKTSAHGRMINYDGAVACGLNINLIDLRSPAWNDLWELYVRSDWAVGNACSKLIESTNSSINVPRMS